MEEALPANLYMYVMSHLDSKPKSPDQSACFNIGLSLVGPVVLIGILEGPFLPRRPGGMQFIML